MSGNLHFEITATNSDFKRKLQESRKAIINTGKTAELQASKIKGSFERMAKGVAALGGAIAIGSLGKQLYNFSNAFEKSMLEVSTLSKTVSGDMDSFKESVLDMTTKIPVQADKVAKALYQIVSAGHDGAAGLQILEIASKAAVGGVTDAVTAADAITTLLNAYKLEVGDASNISDQLFTTVRLGKTTFGELGQSISTVAPIAASFGIEMDQVLAAVATLTKSGVPTAQAMTQIRASILASTKVLGDGYFATHTFQEGLLAISQRANGSEKELRKLIPEIEALTGVLGLTGLNAKMAASDLAELNSSLGATEEAYFKMMQGTEQQLILLQNNMLKIFSSIGDGVLDVTGVLAKFLNSDGVFSDTVLQDLIATLGVLIATVGVYKTSMIATNAVGKVATNLKYANEIAELEKLIIVKKASKNQDLQQLVNDKKMSVSQMQRIALLREEANEKLRTMRVSSRKADLAVKNTKASSYALNVGKAKINQSKIYSLQTDALNKKIAFNTLQQNINNASSKAGAKAKGLMIVATGRLSKAFGVLSLAFKTNPLGLILTGITLAISAISMFRKETEETTDSQEKLLTTTRELTSAIDEQSASRYLQMKSFEELQKLYPETLGNMTLEKYLLADKVALLKQMNEEADNSSFEKQEKDLKTLKTELKELDISVGETYGKYTSAGLVAGVAIGSVVPVVGTSIGAAIGAVSGAAVATWESVSNYFDTEDTIEKIDKLEKDINDRAETFRKAQESKQPTKIRIATLDGEIARIESDIKTIDELLLKKQGLGSDPYSFSVSAQSKTPDYSDSLNDILLTGQQINATAALNSKTKEKEALIQQTYKEDVEKAKKDLEDKSKLYKDLTNDINATSDDISKAKANMVKSETEYNKLLSLVPNFDNSNYGESYDKAKKEWAEAKKDFEQIEKDKNEYTTKQYEEAKKRADDTKKSYASLGGETSTSNDYENLIKAQQEDNNSLEKDNQDALTSLSNKGKEDRIAIIEQEHQERLEIITEAENKAREVAKKEGKAFDGVVFDDARGISNEQKELDTKGYEELELTAMNEYLVKYGDNQEKKLAITRLYANKIAKAKTEGERKTLVRERDDEIYTIELKDYEDYAKEYISKVTQFNKDRKKLDKDLDKGKISKKKYDTKTTEQDNSLIVLQEEFDIKEQSFIDFVDGLIGKSTTDLLELLKEAERALGDAVRNGAESPTIEALNAQVEILKQTVEASEKDTPKEFDTKLDKYKAQLDAIQEIGSAAKSISSALSDVEGDISSILDTVGSVSTSISGLLSGTINLIESTTASAGAGIAAVGKGAAVSLTAVEKASVILAIVGAALQIITAIADVIVKNFSKTAQLNKEIETLDGQVDSLESSYNKLGKAIDDAYSYDATELIAQQDKNLEQQKALVEEQKRLEQSKKKPDTEAIDGYNEQIDGIDTKLEESKEKAIDAIFGSDLKSAVDEFANAYVDAWASGEDKASTTKDVVKNMVQGVITELVKANIKPSVEAFRKRLAEAMADGKIDAEEQADLDLLEQGITDSANQYNDPSLDQYKDDDTKEREASKKGIATASQDSVDINNGLLTTQVSLLSQIQMDVRAMSVKSTGSMVFDDPSRLQLSEAFLQNAGVISSQLNTIAENTAYCRYLETMANDTSFIRQDIGSLRTSINNIELHGIKIKS